MDKIEFAKVYTFDSILKHLAVAKDDRRERERKRAQVALKKINSWLNEGIRIYEKEQRKRAKVEGQAQEV
jgi:hypothetical protein